MEKIKKVKEYIKSTRKQFEFIDEENYGRRTVRRLKDGTIFREGADELLGCVVFAHGPDNIYQDIYISGFQRDCINVIICESSCKGQDYESENLLRICHQMVVQIDNIESGVDMLQKSSKSRYKQENLLPDGD